MPPRSQEGQPAAGQSAAAAPSSGSVRPPVTAWPLIRDEYRRDRLSGVC
jgi:hypothetical protein